jgi:hypothetical protein
MKTSFVMIKCELELLQTLPGVRDRFTIIAFRAFSADPSA